jgi:dolichol-phosphate mannosyltransferase
VNAVPGWRRHAGDGGPDAVARDRSSDEDRMRVSVVVPCFNEAEALEALAGRLRDARAALPDPGALDVVLVDDGSTDDTAARAAAAFSGFGGFRMLRHERNRGLGAALRTGFAAARGDVVCTLDADGTYDPGEVPRLLERLTDGVDIVTASPYHPRGRADGVPGWRLLLSRGLSLLYAMALPGRLHTYSSLFRAYRRAVVERLAFQSDGFPAVSEIMARALLSGARVAEYPTTLHARTTGRSKLRTAPVIRAHVALLARVAAARLAGRKDL